MGMQETIRETAKGALGRGAYVVSGQCRFDRTIFVLAHMRCGSTALSNVVCSHPDVSGFGEAHVTYRGPADLGRLVVVQARRGAWRPRARRLFDKVLHSAYDDFAPPAFSDSRAIFLSRPPRDAIPSILRLFAGLQGTRWRSAADAADYYVERLAALGALWERFPPERRIALTYEGLTADPDAALARVSAMLDLSRPLMNRYHSHDASRSGGGGDPLRSGTLDRIAAPVRRKAPTLDLDPIRRRRVEEAHETFQQLTGRAEG